jgi:hypothetical protein
LPRGSRDGTGSRATSIGRFRCTLLGRIAGIAQLCSGSAYEVAVRSPGAEHQPAQSGADQCDGKRIVDGLVLEVARKRRGRAIVDAVCQLVQHVRGRHRFLQFVEGVGDLHPGLLSLLLKLLDVAHCSLSLFLSPPPHRVAIGGRFYGARGFRA